MEEKIEQGILQKMNRKISEARGFSGWVKLVVLAVIGTFILMSFNLVLDTENSAPSLVTPFLWIASGIPSAYICYILAKSKKRIHFLWIVLGFIFNIFAITAIFVMPKSQDGIF